MTPSIARRAGRLLGERMAVADDGEGPGIGKGDAAIAATAMDLFSLVTLTSRPSPESPSKRIGRSG